MAILTENGLSHTIEKIINLLKGKSSTDHKHTKSDITDFPTLGTSSSKDVASSGNASTTQVVMGNDTRLTDARKASDVSAWAKASTKPTYTASEVGLGNVGNFKAVSTVASQGLTDTEKVNARSNINAQVAGSYASTSHIHDDRYYTESEINTKLNGKANSSHTHGNGDITSLDAGKITSGTISIDRLPQGALERLTVVADDTARFKLTSSTIQKGDTVKVTATGKMYYVVDETKLSSEAGYEVYAAGTAVSVPWSGVTGKPGTYTPSSHTHTKSQITDYPSSLPANGGNASTVNGHTVNSDVPSGAKFTDTTYTDATTSAHGLMTSDMVTKLDGIETGANAYTHPTTSGNKHIPSGGSSGQVLKYSSDGTATWGTVDVSSLSLATESANGLMSSTQFKNLRDLISTNVSAMGTKMPSSYGRILKVSSPINGSGNDAYGIGIDTHGRLYTYFGNNGSTTAKWHEVLLTSDMSVRDISIASLTLGSMTLQGNYDGDAPQSMVEDNGEFIPFCIIPRSSGSADVCWIDCYIDSNSKTKVRLKNTLSGSKTFKPSVFVIYRRPIS